MGLKKNMGRTERIIRMSAGVAGIMLSPPFVGVVQWLSLGLGIFFLATGLINF